MSRRRIGGGDDHQGRGRGEGRMMHMAGLGVVLAISMSVVAQAAPQSEPYRDPSLGAPERAADLVARMTLEEKAGQLRDVAPAIPRLGVPRYNWWSEGLHGVARAGNATVFPQAIGLAATWDAPLIHDVADVISTEFRAKYVERVGADGGSDKYRGLTVWSPNINIFRDPRWGRGQETYGEDPYLTARLGVAFIHGLQGDDPKVFKTIATAKHFAVHSGPEVDRHREDVHPSAYDLEDTYLPAFRASVIEGKVQAFMCAYNAVDDVPACANRPLLDRLRKTWGFSGHVVSDCAAVSDFFRPDAHLYVKTPEEAVAAGFSAGMDLICGEFGQGKSADYQPIVTAVRDGRLAEAVVDQAARRLFEARIRLGLFDPPASNAFARIPASQNDTPEHRALALAASKASLVLLKNDGVLPLKTPPKRIAVIGPNADSVDALVGNYNGTPSAPVTLLAGVKARFPQAEVTFVEGTGLVGSPMAVTPDTIFCADVECQTRGLKVETFDGLSLEGAPTEVRADANVRFSWGRPDRKDRKTSMRWSGYVVPTETGVHRFRLSTNSGYRLYVDGKLALDAWGAAAPTAAQEAVVDLRAGHAHALTVEAIQSGDRGDLRLSWSRPSQGVEAALAAVRQADLVIFAAGLTSRLEGEEMQVNADGFANGDRTSLDLPAPQQALLEKLQATGKPVILVLMNGSAMSVNWADRHVPAIIEAWYPGGEGGHAIASLIAGDFSPSGKLPVTFYRSADDLPGFKDYAMAGRTYRYFKGEALYPFGYGLSFTRFAYAAPVLERTNVAAGEATAVTVSVTNTGDRDSAEVVQLYVSRPGTGGPIRALQSFQRVTLKAGETRQVRLALDARALSVVDSVGARHVEPGRVDLWIGGGQPEVRAGLVKSSGVSTSLQISGRKTLEP
jgi:beta-glucosidase